MPPYLETPRITRRLSTNCVGSADPRVRGSLPLSYEKVRNKQVHMQYDTVIDAHRCGQNLDRALKDRNAAYAAQHV